MPIITFTTDFGTQDPFVGVMKGVALSTCAGATLVDLTHAIEPHDVATASFLLCDAARFFPPGTVHVAVVDPGVGTRRRALALRAGTQFFVGPDNGLFSDVLAVAPGWSAVEAADSRFHRLDVSTTFHGRDIFTPVAAHLASGVALSELGPGVTDPVRLPPPVVEQGPDRLVGAVLHVDRFGNVFTSLRDSVVTAWLGARPHSALKVRCGEMHARGLHRTFGDVEEGACVAYLGSSGVLELAVRNGSAARAFGLARHMVVELTLE